MKRLIQILAATAAMLIGQAAWAAGYTMLATPQPASSAQIEVRNFFFYGCPHCFHLHQQMAAWEKSPPADVNLVYSPVIFNSTAEPLARTYFALESIGQARQLHDAIFKAVHVDGRDLPDENKIADFIATQGVDRAKFLAAYNSPGVQGKVAAASQLSQNYLIRGTPTLIVDGKYVITGLTPEETARVLNEVIDQVRKQRTPAPTTAATAVAVQETVTPKTVTPQQEAAPVAKQAKTPRTTKAKPMRSQGLDFRHCLELTDNAAIAKCAGE